MLVLNFSTELNSSQKGEASTARITVSSRVARFRSVATALEGDHRAGNVETAPMQSKQAYLHRRGPIPSPTPDSHRYGKRPNP